MTRRRSFGWPAAHPSIYRRNSVFNRRLASFSPDVRARSMESISSTKMTDGWHRRATTKSARTIFSPSPTHLDVRDEAEILKNEAFDSVATAFAWERKPSESVEFSEWSECGGRSPSNEGAECGE